MADFSRIEKDFLALPGMSDALSKQFEQRVIKREALAREERQAMIEERLADACEKYLSDYHNGRAFVSDAIAEVQQLADEWIALEREC